ncbi:uncharacterized protein LOC142764790 isoform X7 [Rhipicephalus microplus]|uniref:uncharacterized protein LOC142764790 isoform X7 n=1 Tax=Rhipicephalus microplus TaxID=6941 RepID=UPI003F6C5A6B
MDTKLGCHTVYFIVLWLAMFVGNSTCPKRKGSPFSPPPTPPSSPIPGPSRPGSPLGPFPGPSRTPSPPTLDTVIFGVHPPAQPLGPFPGPSRLSSPPRLDSVILGGHPVVSPPRRSSPIPGPSRSPPRSGPIPHQPSGVPRRSSPIPGHRRRTIAPGDFLLQSMYMPEEGLAARLQEQNARHIGSSGARHPSPSSSPEVIAGPSWKP